MDVEIILNNEILFTRRLKTQIILNQSQKIKIPILQDSHTNNNNNIIGKKLKRVNYYEGEDEEFDNEKEENSSEDSFKASDEDLDEDDKLDIGSNDYISISDENNSRKNLRKYGMNIYQNDPPEEQIKKIIINHFIEKNLQKIKEEKNKLSQQETRLKNYQNEFKTANDKIDNFMNNQGAIFNNCQNDINTLNNKIMELTQYNQSRQNEGLTKENFMNFIQISDTKTISLIAKEAFLEELLMFIKKAVEKNKIDFSDAVKVIRSNSRTLFETRYMREKRTSTNYMI